MKVIAIAAAALGFAALATAPAEAGCLKGALVGGIAGHFVGHGGLGAAAGCAYGVHRNREQRAYRRDDMNMGRSGYGGYNGSRY
ncbi:MAG: hypothetical protein QOC72_2561 [Methylobacteriaceae bacterium]|jgi:hypothetical protein|nr:hypothetical protein [Methylobacteriaceae bacterium]